MKKIFLCILCMSLVFSLLGAFGISALEENRLDDSSLSVDLDSVIEYIDNNITVTENPDGSMQYTLKPVASSISISEVKQYESSTVITQAPLYATAMPDYTYTKNQTHTAIPMEKRYLYSLLDEEWKGYYRQIDKAVRNVEEGVDFTVDSESLRQKRLYFLYMFDNPELFYLASTITMYSYGNGSSGYRFVYSVSNTEYTGGSYSNRMPLEEFKPLLIAKKERFQQAVNDFISTIPADAPEIVKENLIYSKILMNSYYNLSAQWDGLAEDNWTAYGIIYNGYGVCESYAEAFQTLCNAVGIQCTGVVGTAGGGHKWNAVNISGEWYQCDITFDDPIGGEPDAAYHYYFNLTDKQMSSLDHDWSSCDFTVPVCNGTQWGRDNFKAVFGECTYGTMHYYLNRYDTKCENCGEVRWVDQHICVDVVEVPDEKYLVSAANCTHAAIYYKSCSECGAALQETFEYGVPTKHTYSNIWTTTSTEHWRKCNNCTDTIERAEHTGGTATTTTQAKCEICGVSYGELIPTLNGWFEENGIWYYYENDVKVKNAWREDSNGWCFLDEEGRWVLDSFVKDSTNKWAYITKDGYYYETTGWVEYDGHWYYLEKGYRVENDWRKDSTGWCFLDEEGKWVLNSFVKDSTGMWAYITPDGYYYETTGWIEYDGGWYYLEKGYAVTSQWRKDSVGWCYLSESGRMVTNDFVPDSMGMCYIGGEGYMLEVTDWQLHNDQWYYLQNGYAVTNDWRLDSKGWCYLGEDGAMLTSTWFRDSVGWCYIDENGYCLANGTYEVDGHEYTFDADGRIEGEPIQE